MARLTAAKRSELESFWRAHLDGWRRSDLNQREYCEQPRPIGGLVQLGNGRSGLGDDAQRLVHVRHLLSDKVPLSDTI